jgi:hypothetical protein
MKRSFLVLVLLAVLVPSAVFAQADVDPEFRCPVPYAFGSQAADGTYMLDLLCQPMLMQTIEIPVDGSITVAVNMANFYAATGGTSATFDIHFAMDRARVLVREPDGLEGVEITDAQSAFANIPLTTDEETYTFVVENRGMRSAILEISVIPQINLMAM